MGKLKGDILKEHSDKLGLLWTIDQWQTIINSMEEYAQQKVKYMKREYKIEFLQDSIYEVIEIITTYGERISAYDSEHDTVQEQNVFQGRLADCEAYIRLKECGYM